MDNDYSSERLEYQSGQRNEKERRGEYTPRPKSQIVLAWVLIAVVVFGILGMFLGVPVFAIIYLLISDSVNNKLRKKNLTTDTTAYGPISEVAELPEQDRTAAP